MSSSLRKDIKDIKVSSVLNNDRKMYGKKYLVDGNEETCWNSNKGVPQWIEFSFDAEKSVEKICIQFQGGFASKSCTLECIAEENQDANLSDKKKFEFYPKDSNEAQSFILDSLLSAKKFKLTFTTSFDFYGRIIIYDFDVIGN